MTNLRLIGHDPVLYSEFVEGLREDVTDEFIGVQVSAVLGPSGPVVRFGDVEMTPGQAHLVIARLRSALAHLEELVVS